MAESRAPTGTDASARSVRRFELRHSQRGRALAIAAPVTELGLFGVLVSYGIEPESAALLLGLLWSISLGYAWFVFAAYYEVNETTLRMVHGPWRREIALTDLLRVRPIRTLDRGPVVQIDIAYGRQLLLSPVERDAFIEGLEARQPELRAQPITGPR